MTDSELLEMIVSEIVAEPRHVEVKRSIDEQGVLLTLSLAKEDMGKVIGRQGNTITGIRTVMRAAGMKQGARVNVKILEPEGSEQYGNQERQ